MIAEILISAKRRNGEAMARTESTRFEQKA